MRTELIKLHEENPDNRKIDRVVKTLKKGGLIILPTDTIYALSCDVFNSKALEKLKRLKRSKAKHLNFSFLCYDLSHISEYAIVDTPTFKLMKKTLPGPYTFILKASSKVPKILNAKKKTIGIRVPDNNIPRMLVRTLLNPIISTSIHDDNIHEYATDPEEIFNEFQNQVDIVIDGGFGDVKPSTVIDCTSEEPTITREGKGDISII